MWEDTGAEVIGVSTPYKGRGKFLEKEQCLCVFVFAGRNFEVSLRTARICEKLLTADLSEEQRCAMAHLLSTFNVEHGIADKYNVKN